MDAVSRQIRAFAVVAELGSFTRAAERLHLTQPALSNQIAQLERHLGFRLFDRTTRHVVPSREGESLLASARTLIRGGDEWARTVAGLRDERARRVRLGAAIYTSDIPERRTLIETFAEDHRGIELRIAGELQPVLIAELLTGGIDLALVIGFPVDREAYDGGSDSEVLFPSDLCRLVLRREPVTLLCPPDDPLAQHGAIDSAMLAGREVAMPAMAHGAQLMAPIVAYVEDAGARVVTPPDASGLGVERYGRRHRSLAISFGWFDQPPHDEPPFVRKRLVGLELETWFALLAAPDPLDGAPARFLASAERLFGTIHSRS